MSRYITIQVSSQVCSVFSVFSVSLATFSEFWLVFSESLVSGAKESDYELRHIQTGVK